MKRVVARSVLMSVAMLAFTSGSAWANTITPSFVSFNPGVSISYNADLTSAELVAGDGFTIFDIAGYTGFGAVNPLWTPTSSVSGSIQGLSSLGPDNASLTNVTFTYNGQTIEVLGAQTFTPFTVLTTATSLVLDDWVSRDHLVGGIGTVGDGGVGTIHRDTIVVPAAASVPDGGSTAALLGSVLVAFGMVRRKLGKG